MCFPGRCHGADQSKVRGDPGEIKRVRAPSKVSAVDGAQTKGEDEVVDDAGPESVGHAEVFARQEGQLLEAEQRVGRQDEGPDLVEVGVGEAEGLEHGGEVAGSLRDGCGSENRQKWLGSGALPEGGFGVDIGKEGAGDLGEQCVEVR